MPAIAWPRLLPPARVLELEDVAVVDAGAAQRARRGEAGDAGADDDGADAARQRDLGRAARLRRRPAVAHAVAALVRRRRSSRLA